MLFLRQSIYKACANSAVPIQQCATVGPGAAILCRRRNEYLRVTPELSAPVRHRRLLQRLLSVSSWPSPFCGAPRQARSWLHRRRSPHCRSGLLCLQRHLQHQHPYQLVERHPLRGPTDRQTSLAGTPATPPQPQQRHRCEPVRITMSTEPQWQSRLPDQCAVGWLERRLSVPQCICAPKCKRAARHALDPRVRRLITSFFPRIVAKLMSYLSTAAEGTGEDTAKATVRLTSPQSSTPTPTNLSA